jgi:hypothetical protein
LANVWTLVVSSDGSVVTVGGWQEEKAVAGLIGSRSRFACEHWRCVALPSARIKAEMPASWHCLLTSFMVGEGPSCAEAISDQEDVNRTSASHAELN